jgi:ribonuclease III
VKNIQIFEKILGYSFKDRSLLKRALIHRSVGGDNNERLEFLGDSVLNCVVAELLFERFFSLPEGDLSRIRASLVCQQTLFEIAISLRMPEFILLGEGELRSGGAKRPSILADALEASFGAIFSEGGFSAARDVIRRLFEPRLNLDGLIHVDKDDKSRLQEVLQGLRKPLPIYTVMGVHGAAHDQQFEVICDVAAFNVRAQGFGVSRRTAEQQAATAALAIIELQLKQRKQQRAVKHQQHVEVKTVSAKKTVQPKIAVKPSSTTPVISNTSSGYNPPRRRNFSSRRSPH